MSYRAYENSPGPVFITLLGIALVFGLYLLWTGFTQWIERAAEDNRAFDSTQTAYRTATYANFGTGPTLVLFPTSTPIPPCQYYEVRGPQAAFVRECPSTACADVSYVEAYQEVCVIGRAQSDEYPNADEWFEVLLDPSSFMPELLYMNEITLRSLNPTPTPSPTLPVLPSVTPLPTNPISQPAVTSTPLPSATPESEDSSF